MSRISKRDDYRINGIQQVGIGVPDVDEAWAWYRKAFKVDVPVFRDAGEAPYMTLYTGGQIQSRDAVLAMNLQGGGAFEIWQFTSRNTQFPPFVPVPGDLGINWALIKVPDLRRAVEHLKQAGAVVLSGLDTEGREAPEGSEGGSEQRSTVFLKDPRANLFALVESDDWFGRPRAATGGVAGAAVGVSDIERARRLYGDVLGYDRTVYDLTGEFPELEACGGSGRYRRVLLTHSMPRSGPFSRLLGTSSIELIQTLDNSPRPIFEGRYWGDAGFIHLCFDVWGTEALLDACRNAGFKVTVDTGESFDMGEAGGRFAYIEDGDGTLIEFVETRRIPLMKRFKWYLDLDKRSPDKPLPNWMLKTMKFSRVKD